MIKAYKINAAESRVETVRFNERRSRESIGRLIGSPVIKVGAVAEKAKVPGRRLMLYVGDVTASKNAEHFFYWGATQYPFAGNGILVAVEGRAEKGRYVDIDVPIEHAIGLSSFLHKISTGGKKNGTSVYTNVGPALRN